MDALCAAILQQRLWTASLHRTRNNFALKCRPPTLPKWQLNKPRQRWTSERSTVAVYTQTRPRMEKRKPRQPLANITGARKWHQWWERHSRSATSLWKTRKSKRQKPAFFVEATSQTRGERLVNRWKLKRRVRKYWMRAWSHGPDSDLQGKTSIECTGPGREFLSKSIAMTTYHRPCPLALSKGKRRQRTHRRGISNRSATLKRPDETRRAIETNNHKEILPPAV